MFLESCSNFSKNLEILADGLWVCFMQDRQCTAFLGCQTLKGNKQEIIKEFIVENNTLKVAQRYKNSVKEGKIQL